MAKHFFTSESVTEGHPDKVCDRISDAVVDAILKKDKSAHIACEAMASTNYVSIVGEISTVCDVDIESIAREAIRFIGYDDDKYGFNCDNVKMNIFINKQSPDIAMGVNHSVESRGSDGDELDVIGAGDQGMMFGFACDETEELMPLAISLAHRLSKKLTDARKSGEIAYLRPDGKSQVTVEYDGDTVKRIDTVVISAQHDEVDLETLRRDIIEKVIRPIVPAGLLDDNTRFIVNPTGRFEIGGPAGDSGLTGRKIIVDTYGGYARHGGGAFSGKDPTKVDRSAAYYARYIAKNIVAAKIAKKCEIQLAYAIGVAHPVSIMIDTFSTSKYSEEAIISAVRKVFDCRPAAIIRDLRLLDTEYTPMSAYGHMGRTDVAPAWERTDRIQALLSALND